MPEPDQPPERGRALRRAQNTRQRLMESALSVFTQQGVDACSIEDITELADVGKGTFYRHFNDKTAILCALTEATLLDLSATIRERMTGCESIPVALEKIGASETDWCIKHPSGFRLLLEAQALLVVRPQALAPLQLLFRSLVADVEVMLRPLASAQTDDASFRGMVLTALSAPLGALALQHAVQGFEHSGPGEMRRPGEVAALPSGARAVVPAASRSDVVGG